MKKLLIVDISNIAYASYYGYQRNGFKDPYGKPVFMHYGLIKKMTDIINEIKPDYTLGVMDTPTNSLCRREGVCSSYKRKTGSRSEKPSDLQEQLNGVADTINGLGVCTFAMDGYEADDLIAGVVNLYKTQDDIEIIIVTGDKDLTQLVDSKHDVSVFLNNKKGDDGLQFEKMITESDVADKFGVKPVQIPSLFAMIGDKADNIISVNGIGEETAKGLLGQYTDIHDIYRRLSTVDPNIARVLDENKGLVMKNYILASPFHAPIMGISLADMVRDKDYIVKLASLSNKLGFFPLVFNKILGLNFESELQVRQQVGLSNILYQYAESYYNHGVSLIDDQKYDALYANLKDAEERSKYVHHNSPTAFVGFAEIGADVVHTTPMLSLENTYNEDELLKWMTAMVAEGAEVFTLEPKIDGISAELQFKGINLKRAVTRGDGITGRDITANVSPLVDNIRNLKISSLNEVIFRGELFISVDHLESINEMRRKLGKDPIQNTRNGVAAIATVKDAKELKGYNIQFYPFNMMSDHEFLTIKHMIKDIFQDPMITHYTYKLSDGKSRLMELLSKIRTQMAHMQIPTDGVVVNVSEFTVREKLGSNNKFPRYARAYKFSSDTAKTTISDIRWQVGRSGAITPVASINPVALNGSLISRVTLHNLDIFNFYKPHRYDSITIVKAGEVIPDVVDISRNDKSLDPFVIPTTCPSCGSTLINEDNRKLWCKNPFCEEKTIQLLTYVVSKDVLDIKHMGESNIRELFSQGMRTIEELLDINLVRSKLNGLIGQGFGDTSVDRLCRSLAEKLDGGIGIDKILVCMNIPFVGKRFSKQIMLSNTKEDIIDGNITLSKGMGPSVQKALDEFFSKYPNRIRNLASRINIKEHKTKMISKKLLGETVCISGKLPMVKDKIAMIVESHGGIMVNSVSGNTTRVIAEELTSKVKKAKAKGIPVMTLEEFKKFLK